MSKTPRTDAEEILHGIIIATPYTLEEKMTRGSFSRQLERDLSLKDQRIAELEKRLSPTPEELLLGESLRDLTLRNLRDASNHWSAARDINGNFDEAECDLASALERRTKEGIKELSDRAESLQAQLAESRKSVRRYSKLVGMLFQWSLHFRGAGSTIQLCNDSDVLGEGAGADAAIDAAQSVEVE